ncbi:MAG: hypothetical protein HC913_08405 [Microscillaceae bacterium]|nr:hypothetical protein [Microscillaceae bacterium]
MNRLNTPYFSHRKAAQLYFAQHPIVGIFTDYTVFKLEPGEEGVIFRCLLNQHTFVVFYEQIEKTLPPEAEHWLQALVAFQQKSQSAQSVQTYPICEFEQMDDLLDWFWTWKQWNLSERQVFLEELLRIA